MPVSLNLQGIKHKLTCQYPRPSSTPKLALIWYLFIHSAHTMNTYFGKALRKTSQPLGAYSLRKEMSSEAGTEEQIQPVLYVYASLFPVKNPCQNKE